MSTPTPRTDAAQFWDRSDYHDPSAFDWFVRAEHARTLERELHESRNAERLARVQLGNEREKVRALRRAMGIIERKADEPANPIYPLDEVGDIATAALAATEAAPPPTAPSPTETRPN
jgi:hypothetical protein